MLDTIIPFCLKLKKLANTIKNKYMRYVKIYISISISMLMISILD